MGMFLVGVTMYRTGVHVGVVTYADGAATAPGVGARAKGEYRCTGCGYGVTIYRELPRCPMCWEESWEQIDRSPLGRALSPVDEPVLSDD